MAIWKDSNTNKKEAAPTPTEAARNPTDSRSDFAPKAYDSPRRAPASEPKESLIAAELTIEGKIEGAGNIRLAGRFKGDVQVDGNLTIEPGAKLTGSVQAGAVIIAGELDGNIESASRVELLETGVLNGDLTAGSLTVAAGSRMRGQVEFGWDDKSKSPALPKVTMETAAAS